MRNLIYGEVGNVVHLLHYCGGEDHYYSFCNQMSFPCRKILYDQPRGKFFCPECVKRMKERVNWNWESYEHSKRLYESIPTEKEVALYRRKTFQPPATDAERKEM